MVDRDADFEVTPGADADSPSLEASRERATGKRGGEYVRLRPHSDHRGMLTEVLDVSQSFWREPVVYAYMLTVRPERMKGWGLHSIPPGVWHADQNLGDTDAAIVNFPRCPTTRAPRTSTESIHIRARSPSTGTPSTAESLAFQAA